MNLIKQAFVLLVLTISCQNSKHNSLSMKDENLIAVTLSVSKGVFKTTDSIGVHIELMNQSKKEILLPVSLDMGYESSINRNFYLQVKDTSGHILSGKDEISDYNRIYILPADQRRKEIQPGERITSNVNLNEWYHLTPGIYQIRVAFDPEKEETDLPAKDLPVYSDWTTIEIVK